MRLNERQEINCLFVSPFEHNITHVEDARIKISYEVLYVLNVEFSYRARYFHILSFLFFYKKPTKYTVTWTLFKTAAL